MDRTNTLSRGENGAMEYSNEGVQESRVALFFALVRGLPSERLLDLMNLVVEDARTERNPNIIVDIFIMAFQTRHCRGGKGERDLFYKMVLQLVLIYPQTVESLMCIVPRYSSFKDWFQLVDLATDEEKTDANIRRAMIPVTNTIFDLAVDQLLKDQAALKKMKGSSTSGDNEDGTGGISLLAKWAPREKKRFQKQARVLANKLFPTSKAPKKEYRQLLSRLNKAIGSCEIKMSSNHWSEIEFSKVPSICLMKHRKAFLNENILTSPLLSGENETGNRHPLDEERVVCRKRLRDTMVNSKVQKLKGRQLDPHQIVQKFMQQRTYQLSPLEVDLFACQWADIRSSIITAMAKVQEEKFVNGSVDGDAQEGVNLGKVVPIVDVSGSMRGTPMEVAIAIGLLVSELTDPAFANRCLTFSETPQWVQFKSNDPLQKKVEDMLRAPWGVSTDFEKATELILEIAINANLEPKEIPDLIVFSDMQFDQAQNGGSSWETHHERIVRRFKEEGLQACGKEWPAPHIIYWNLRGDTYGSPAQGNTSNVTMLSGFSPALLKLLLHGEPIKSASTSGTGDGEDEDKANYPFITVRKALDSDDYSEVRQILSESNEGMLKDYDLVEAVFAEVEKGWEVVLKI